MLCAVRGGILYATNRLSMPPRHEGPLPRQARDRHDQGQPHQRHSYRPRCYPRKGFYPSCWRFTARYRAVDWSAARGIPAWRNCARGAPDRPCWMYRPAGQGGAPRIRGAQHGPLMPAGKAPGMPTRCRPTCAATGSISTSLRPATAPRVWGRRSTCAILRATRLNLLAERTTDLQPSQQTTRLAIFFRTRFYEVIRA